MRKLRGQLLRWTLIIRIIQNHPYISFKDLQREIERELVFRGYDAICSDATLKRDIYELREELGIEIDYSRENNGYSISSVKKDWLDIDCIIEPLELLISLGTENILPDYILPETYQTKGTQHLSYILHAIRFRKKISFLYRKYADNSSRERILSPYILKEWRGRWYVVGKDEQGIYKTFGLDRIDRLHITADTFSKDTAFDASEKFQYSYGIYSSEEYPIEDIILAFDSEDGNYLKSRPLHTSQKVIKEDDSSVLIQLRLRITPDFIMEIISRSWSVRVIQPESLKKRICNIYEEALKRNSI